MCMNLTRLWHKRQRLSGSLRSMSPRHNSDTLETGRRIRLGVLACSAIPLYSQQIPH
jgi:hypothetical protein